MNVVVSKIMGATHMKAEAGKMRLLTSGISNATYPW
jgi:hypothetical protein